MPTYDFATITAAQALNIQPTDTVTISTGTALQTTVLFDTDNHVTVIVGARSVVFGSNVSQIASLANGGILFPDGTALYIGDNSGNGFLLPSPLSGAVYGSGGDDFIQGGEGHWLVQGNTGGDRIELRDGNNTVYGGQDSDIINFSNAFAVGGGNNFGQGNKGDDSLLGSSTSDTLLGGQGSDTINGVNGTDLLDGNLGDDSISGSGQVLGEGGDDTLAAGFDFAATLNGGDGNDRIFIGDRLADATRHALNVTVIAGDGDDRIESTNTRPDSLPGGAGNDTIISASNDATGGDTLQGDDGDDLLQIDSGGGFNLLLGGNGNDTLTGGSGNDTIDAGFGGDVLRGGAGADRFILNTSTTGLAITTTSADKILDWSSSDRIQLKFAGAPGYTETTAGDFPAALTAANQIMAGGLVEVVAFQVGPDVVIFTDGTSANTVDSAIILMGRSLADISGSNFI